MDFADARDVYEGSGKHLVRVQQEVFNEVPVRAQQAVSEVSVRAREAVRCL